MYDLNSPDIGAHFIQRKQLVNQINVPIPVIPLNLIPADLNTASNKDDQT